MHFDKNQDVKRTIIIIIWSWDAGNTWHYCSGILCGVRCIIIENLPGTRKTMEDYNPILVYSVYYVHNDHAFFDKR